MVENVDLAQIELLDEIWHRLIRLSHSNDLQTFNERLKGVTTLEISVLDMVSKKPDIILREIVQKLQVPSSTLTSAVDRLEKRGYLKRVISERDRRSYGLELSTEGYLAQQEHKKSEQLLFETLLKSLDTNAERESLLKLMKKIIDRLSENY